MLWSAKTRFCNCRNHATHCESLLVQLSTGGLATCTDCEPGYYSSLVGSLGGCTYCPKGKYSNKSGSATCTDCEAGRYGDKTTQGDESIACNLCAEGHYGDKPGATSRQCTGPCPMGSYTRPGAIACKLCPEGRYGNVVGSGVVGFTTPVCSGECYGAPPGSTCCPPSRGWAGNCPGDASPSPSSSSSKPAEQAPSPSSSSATSDQGSASATIAIAVGAIGVAVVGLLVAACVTLWREKSGEASVEGAQETDMEREEVEEGEIETTMKGKGEQKGKEKNENKKKPMMIGAGAVPKKTNQVLPAAFTSSNISSKTGSLKVDSVNPFATNETLFTMAGATSGKGSVFALTYTHNNPGPSSAATATFDLALGTAFQPSVVQGSGVTLFKTCQAKIGLWKHLEVRKEDVKRGKLLGKGSYAEVYRGQALGVDCAIKLFRSTASAKQLEDARREIALGASLDHPCTLRILGWVRAPLQTITELCRGDLCAFYNDKIEAVPYSERHALRFLKVGL